MILLLIFAFLAGLVTLLAPCIWPLLPIVLSTSIGEGRRRPLGISLGVVISFTFFTLFTSYLIKAFHIDPNVLRIIAVIIITFLGLTMIFPGLSARLERFISGLIHFFGNRGNQAGNGFLAGLITGLSLGVLWSPCAGPILATIAALAASEKVTLDVVFVTIAYALGVGLPLFVIAYAGNKLLKKTRGLSNYTSKIQQIFGIVTILAAVGIFFNYDQKLQLQVLDKFPALGTAVNEFEKNALVTNKLSQIKNSSTEANDKTLKDFSTDRNHAPEFQGIKNWFNLPEGKESLTLTDLKGKVVLVDFWTYTCINCIRTLPHLISWHHKYHDQGLVVVGVHTPEFAFEKDVSNVRNAINRYSIPYTIAQDNNYVTWNNYNNQYWPAEYLIDVRGVIRHTHFGEGDYLETEKVIRQLLSEAGKNIASKVDTLPDQTPERLLSPETYLGTQRMQYYFPSGSMRSGIKTFTLSKNIPINSFTLGGTWNIADDYAITVSQATLNYYFSATKVFLVLRPGTAAGHPKVKIFLDGQPVNKENQGADVINSEISIDSDKLYNLIDIKSGASIHILHLEFEAPGIEAYAFTFG
jgi:cytochrome c biogenesis protein CcdA/thiol-disulfide isomerase/thioredoxin